VRWTRDDGVVELVLDDAPANEIGLRSLAALERFVDEIGDARAVVVHSTVPAGFSAGADLRELYRESEARAPAERTAGVRAYLMRIHAVFRRLDDLPVPTVAALHGVVFGGGLELALCCDVRIADPTARFAFPELRLGLIPGFGGVPRLKRDVSNALVRDLLLTGRSINANKALQAGLVTQLAAEGRAIDAARAAAAQAAKFDPATMAAAKRFIKPSVDAELAREIELFLELFDRPVVQEALARFVSDSGPMPYLP